MLLGSERIKIPDIIARKCNSYIHNYFKNVLRVLNVCDIFGKH